MPTIAPDKERFTEVVTLDGQSISVCLVHVVEIGDELNHPMQVLGREADEWRARIAERKRVRAGNPPVPIGGSPPERALSGEQIAPVTAARAEVAGIEARLADIDANLARIAGEIRVIAENGEAARTNLLARVFKLPPEEEQLRLLRETGRALEMERDSLMIPLANARETLRQAEVAIAREIGRRLTEKRALIERHLRECIEHARQFEDLAWQAADENLPVRATEQGLPGFLRRAAMIGVGVPRAQLMVDSRSEAQRWVGEVSR